MTTGDSASSDPRTSPTTAASAPAAGARAWLAAPSHRWVRRALWAVASVLALWALGWLGLPPLLKWQGQKIASEQLGRAVTIGAVDFKPWSLELTLRDLAVAGIDNGPPQLSIRRVYANAELQSVFRLAPVLNAIQVDGPALRLKHTGDGHYDIDDILAKLAARPPAPEPSEPARFALYNIELKDGRIDFDDQTVKRQHEVRDLRLTLPFISNLPSQIEVKVQPQLAFVANGSVFDSSAQALPFADSRQADAAFRLSKLDLTPYLGYLPASLPLRLQAAVVDADLRLSFEQTPQPSLRVTGGLDVSGLKSVDGQGADALAFDALKLQLADVRPLERKLHLASIELNGPQISVRRDKEGRINLLLPAGPANASEKIAVTADPPSAGGQIRAQKVPASTPIAQASVPASGASGAAAAGAANPVWQVQVDKVAVHGGTVDVSDDSTATETVGAAAVRLNEVELKAERVGWPLGQPIAFNGSAAFVGTEGLTPALPATGSARATRTARAPQAAASASAASASAPVASGAGVPSLEFQGTAGAQGAEVNAKVAGVPLALAAPYLAQHLAPRLTGKLDAHLGLQWAPPKASDLPPELKVAAERLVLSQVLLADNATGAAPSPARGPARSGRGRAPSGPPASIGQLELSDVLVDLRSRAVTVGKLALQAPQINVARDADQRWMYEAWLRQPPASAKADAAPATKPRAGPDADFPWKVQLAELTLDNGTVGWRDAAPANPVQAELTQLHLSAKQIDLNAKQPIAINLVTRVAAGRNDPGRLSWRGNVGLLPVLSAQGQVDAQRLPVHAFEPYFGDALNIDILRADTSFKGQVNFTQTAQGPKARVSGDVSVEELRTHSRPGTAASADAPAAPASAVAGSEAPSTTQRRLGGSTVTTAAAPARASATAGASQAPLAPGAGADSTRAGGLGEELLSWKQLRLSGLDVQLEPGKPAQVDVKDTQLADFYARLIIHPNGRINLQDVVKSKEGDAAAQAQATAASAATGAGTAPASAAASAASAPAQAVQQVDPNAPVIRFGPVRLANGKVFFSDRFIRPNYSADLTELNGTLSAFSSVAPAGAPQMADLQLTGRAEGTAGLEIKGKLNPLAKPLALDINAKVTDLELPPLSPYAVKYAGHGIERGKLSMDVTYAIQPDGRLSATNKIVLNQLEFGEPVAGAPASLPVKLATALLADSKGVIDLDLPITGSINDPQFSVGPIIFKAIINLIGRAITAPFTLLARALGGSGGDDMSNVAFAPGSAQLSAKSKEQLDKIAKALADRPTLKLTVVGTSSLAAEREGFRRERLKALVAAEKRANESGRGTAASTAPASAASDSIAAGVPSTGASAPLGTASGAPAATDALAVTDAEYPALLRRLYRRADLPGKPRNAIGLQKDLPVTEMESRLMAQIDVNEDAMRQLASQRGVAVKDYLTGKNLPADRLFLGAARSSAAAASPAAGASAPASGASGTAPANAPWSPRAELALSSR